MPISRWKVTDRHRYSLHVLQPKYRLRYPQGAVVVPSRRAPGIWVFDTRDSAEEYAIQFDDSQPKILRVLPIGRAIRLKRYRPRTFGTSTIEAFWKNLAETIRMSCSERGLEVYLCNPVAELGGTLIYPAVRVLD
jgi:hypothetical protein